MWLLGRRGLEGGFLTADAEEDGNVDEGSGRVGERCCQREGGVLLRFGGFVEKGWVMNRLVVDGCVDGTGGKRFTGGGICGCGITSRSLTSGDSAILISSYGLIFWYCVVVVAPLVLSFSGLMCYGDCCSCVLSLPFCVSFYDKKHLIPRLKYKSRLRL